MDRYRNENETDRLLYGWLWLAVFSLVFAGIFAFMVAMARTPVIEDFLPLGRDYIYVALVGHVDMAVVIWFLAFEGFLLTLTSTRNVGMTLWSASLGWISLAIAFAGMFLVGFSALFGMGKGIIVNYIPLLSAPTFYAGVLLFALGISLNLLNTFGTLIKAKLTGKTLPSVTFGMACAGIAVAAAFICFAIAGYSLSALHEPIWDYERFFWGGGHMLQFANTIAMATAWVYLARLLLSREPLSAGVSKLLFLIYILFILPAPFIYILQDINSPGYKAGFTALMQWGLGPSTAVFILATLGLALRNGKSWKDPAFSSLMLSMAIFVLGGIIALTIRGTNTKIPAHYHCVIGAVTIAFMGLFYEIIPAFKKALWSKKMASVQPWLYTLGIVLFAVGLFIAGEHGVARKTYGAAQNLNSMGKIIGMSIMGVGGLVAIAGGITFVLNALLTLLGRPGTALEKASTIGDWTESTSAR